MHNLLTKAETAENSSPALATLLLHRRWVFRRVVLTKRKDAMRKALLMSRGVFWQFQWKYFLLSHEAREFQVISHCSHISTAQSAGRGCVTR